MITKSLIFFMIAGALSQELHHSTPQNRFVQKSLLDDAKSWISPNDGNLATENTPIYGVQRKPNLFGNGDVEYKIVKFRNAMKKVSDFLYKNQSYAIAPLNDQPPPTTEAPSSEGENLNPSTTAKPEPKKDMNTLIEEMMRKNLLNSELIVDQHQTTTPKPSLPYPETVYPEVLVIIDNSLYKKLDSNILRTVIHTSGFFNGVDLLYRNLESPKFRLNIAAILIVQEKDGFPTLEYALDRIDGDSMTWPVEEWLYNHQDTFPLDSYDIAVTLTANHTWGKANGKEILLGGMAYPSGACKVFYDHQLVVKTALVAERGDFHGIRAGAHEIGHSLGINDHDDQPDKGCPKDADTIMFPSAGSNDFKWSQCSLDLLTQTFVTSTAECLYNKPKGGESVPRLMPGKIVNTNTQCHFNEKDTFAVVTENICEHLVCRSHEDSSGSYTQTSYYLGAAIGSTCGQNKICLLGNCVEIK